MSKLIAINKSKKLAIIMSYISLLMHTISNLVLTPLYLDILGVETYGIYQMVYSMAHYILILDIGISTTMVRYISKYNAKGDEKGRENFAAHCLSITIIIMALIAVVGFVLNHFLTDIYVTIPKEMYAVSHKMFLIMIATLIATIAEKFLDGIVMAYEHFMVVKTLAVVKMVIKISLLLLMLYSGVGVEALAWSDLIVELIVITILAIYAFGVIKFKIVFSRFDKALLFSLFTFMAAIFLQSVVAYVNNMVDKTILGIMTNATDVAVYSVAMTFITMFNSLPTVISSVFLPQATKLVITNPDRKTLTNFVARPSRFQFMLCGAMLCGFIIFGKEFITLWTGSESIKAWDIALIIMIPNMIPLIQNVTVCILDAKKKRLFRSVTLFIMSIINVGVSILLVSKIGIIGAPIGTALSYFVGYGIIMNIYYHKKTGINVPSLFKAIFSKTWICILISGIVSLPLNILFKEYSWVTFIIKALFFCLVYATLMLFFGFNKDEKNDVLSIIKKLFRR